MTDSRGCEHEGTKVETASNRLNGVADPEGATALTTHVLQQAPNFAPTIASLGYSANAATDHHILPPESFLSSPAFVAMITSAVKAAQPAPRKPRRDRAAAQPKTRAYCFHHGYDMHNSIDCRHMIAQSFSADKKAAHTHLDVTGGSTNRL